MNFKKFDIFVVETDYCTVEFLEALLLSFLKHGGAATEFARIILAVNYAAPKREKEMFQLLKMCASIDLNIVIMRCGLQSFNRWNNLGWRTAYQNTSMISHGSAVTLGRASPAASYQFNEHKCPPRPNTSFSCFTDWHRTEVL